MEPQREWFDKDYYKILGVSENAADSEISKAYRKLAKKLHPDANPGDTAAEDRFKEAASAYDVLGDAEKRKAYDEVRRLGPIAGGFGPGTAGPGGGFGPGGFRFDFGRGSTDGSHGDIGDLLGDLFGGRHNRGNRRGDDLSTSLQLDFVDAVSGAEVTIPVVSDVLCRSCSGSGTAAGTAPKTCETCDGNGTVDQNQGLFSFSRPCTACAGRGHLVEKPCSACSGRGLERRSRKVKARIPAGVKDGQRVKLKGRGAPGLNGGEPGDLYVQVQVRPHRLFERDGRNVTLTVPVTFSEAALGADISVPTLDGSPVKIRIPPGTASGRRLRVRSRGGAADLIVVVVVVVPERLSDEQRAAVEALAAASPDNPRSHLEV